MLVTSKQKYFIPRENFEIFKIEFLKVKFHFIEKFQKKPETSLFTNKQISFHVKILKFLNNF